MSVSACLSVSSVEHRGVVVHRLLQRPANVGDPLVAPRRDRVETLASGPVVLAVLVDGERTGPVALGEIACGGGEDEIAGAGTVAKDRAEGGMSGPAPRTVAPARHHDGAGRHSRSLVAGPAQGAGERFGGVGFPIREQ